MSIFEDLYLLRNEIDASNQKITLIYGGSGIDKRREQAIKKRANDFLLPMDNITVQGGLVFDNNEDDIEKQKLRGEIDRLYTDLQQSKQRLDSILNDNQRGRTLFLELHALFPSIIEVSYALAPSFSALIIQDQKIQQVNSSSDSNLRKTEIPIESKPRAWVIIRLEKGRKFLKDEHKKLQKWLEIRLGQVVDIFYK